MHTCTCIHKYAYTLKCMSRLSNTLIQTGDLLTDFQGAFLFSKVDILSKRQACHMFQCKNAISSSGTGRCSVKLFGNGFFCFFVQHISIKMSFMTYIIFVTTFSLCNGDILTGIAPFPFYGIIKFSDDINSLQWLFFFSGIYLHIILIDFKSKNKF